MIALVNANEATRQALQTSLEHAGFPTVSPDRRHLQHGRLDLVGFLEDHEPAVVIYDLAPPYAENWRVLEAAGNTGVAKETYFVLTTTNKAALEQEVGPTEVLEISDKPFEHDEVVKAVRRTLEARAQGTLPQ